MFKFIMRSLRLKLILGITLILALIILFWQYIESIAFKQTIYKDLINNCENMVEVIDKIWEEHMLTHKIPEAKKEIKIIGKIERVKLIYFVSQKGKVRFSSDPKLVGKIYGQAEIVQVEKTNKPYFNLLQKDKEKIFLSLTPIKNKPECQHCHGQGQTVGYIGLDLDVKKEIDFFSIMYKTRIKGIILLTPFFYLLLILTIHLFLLVNVHRPVEIIRGGLNKIKEGAFGEKITLKTIDEIGELANSFNLMSVTLQKTAEELVRSAKMSVLGHLSAGVGETLSKPLTEIRNTVHILKMKMDKEEKPELKQALATIEGDITHAERTVTNILQFARPLELQLKLTNLNALIEESISLAEEENLFENIKVNKKLDPDLPEILVDRERVKQALSNLILNAVESMSRGGELTIVTTAEDEKLKIMVSDTGRGIPEENLKDIFSPFFTTKSKGLGLGLMIVKQNIEKHRGKIEVESALGKGTTFIFELPLWREK